METIVSTEYLYPQAVIDNGLTTGNEWTDPNNILAVDNDTAQSNSAQASDIVVGNFTFNIPQDAVVTGIAFKIRGYAAAITSPLTSLSFTAIDNTSGSDVLYPYTAPYTGLTTSMAYHDFGGETYLFATTFTPDQINNLKFQVTASGTVYMDAVMMKVYYYIPSTTTPDAEVTSDTPGYQSQLQAAPFSLALPMEADDTEMYLESFNYPNGTMIQVDDIVGGYLQLTIDPGINTAENGTGFEENVRTASWSLQSNGLVKIDFDSTDDRGLDYKYPYGPSDDNRSVHAAGAKVIITANAPFLEYFVKRTEIGTVVSAPIEVDDESVEKTTAATKLNFTGAGVQVTATDPENAPGELQINIPGVGGATTPIPVSTASDSSGSTQVSSLTYDIDISGTDRVITIQVATEQLVTVTGVTVGGVAATSINTAADVGNNIRIHNWRLIAPSLGTQSIVVTLSGAAYVSSGASVWASCNQSSPIGTTNTATGSSVTPSVALTSGTSYSVIVDGLCTSTSPIAYTPGAGQTIAWSETANADTRKGGSSYEFTGTTPDAVTSSYSLSQSSPWAIASFELKGVAITPVLTGVEIKDEGVSVTTDTNVIDFVGAGVTVSTVAANQSIVTIPGVTAVQRFYTILKTIQGSNVGSLVTTQFDITNPAGTTFRYTYDGTGTDPNINSGTVTVGQVVQVQAQNFAAGNKGTFLVTGVGANYFEVTNASGVVESNKTVGTGYITWNDTWTKSAGLKFITIEGVGAGAGSGGSDPAGVDTNAACGGAAGAYFFKMIPAASLASAERVTIGVRGIGGINTGGDGTSGTATIFGSFATANGGQGGFGTTGGVEFLASSGGTATGGDINIQGGWGFGRLGTATAAISGGKGGDSMFGFGGYGGVPGSGAASGLLYGAGGGGAFSAAGAQVAGVIGSHGALKITEYY